MKQSLIIICSSIFFFNSSAQIGGDNTYEFLNVPTSARTASLGGNVIAVRDNDLNLVVENPSLLDSNMHNNLALSYINYFGDINFGYASYARKMRCYKKYSGIFSAGLQFANYGKFTETDATGQELGEFTAGEYALNIAHAYPIDSMFTIGAAIKTIYSAFEQYKSVGLATDLSGTYLSPNKSFTAALVVRNIGVQLKGYYPGNREPLPFEIMMGFSKSISHAPFRVYGLARHMEKWDLTYDAPDDPAAEIDPLTGERKEKLFTFDKLMRHLVIGLEFIPTKNFSVRAGYNYQRRQELKLASKSGLTGLSFGAGIRISKFHISYGRATYHLAGSSNHVTITTNFSDFYTRSGKNRVKTAEPETDG